MRGKPLSSEDRTESRLFSQVIYLEPTTPMSSGRRPIVIGMILNPLIRHCFDSGSQKTVNSFCTATWNVSDSPPKISLANFCFDVRLSGGRISSDLNGEPQ